MVSIEEVLERVFKVADLTEAEQAAINAAITINSEKSKIEGDLGKDILGKVKKITSESYILNDPETKDKVFQMAQKATMPGIESATRKILQDVFGSDVLSNDKLDSIWGDEKNPMLNNKVYHATKTAKEHFSNQLEELKKGNPELVDKIQALQNTINEKQQFIDSNAGKSEQLVKAEADKWKGVIIADKIINYAKSKGADIEGFEQGFAYQLQSGYHWDLENGSLIVRNKENPDLMVTDPEKKTTLTAVDVLDMSIAPRIDKSGRNQNGNPNKPNHKPGENKGSGGDEGKYKNNYPVGSAAYKRREREIAVLKKREKA